MNKPKTLSSEVVALLLPRLKDELTAFYFYRAAQNWCANVGFFKAAEYFAHESEDELKHAKRIENYLVEWNVTPKLPSVSEPTLEFKNIGDLIQKAYDIEYNLYEEYEDTSMKMFKLDLCVFDFLQEFRSIQQKSVAEYSDKINMLEGVDVADKFKVLMLEDKLF